MQASKGRSETVQFLFSFCLPNDSSYDNLSRMYTILRDVRSVSLLLCDSWYFCTDFGVVVGTRAWEGGGDSSIYFSKLVVLISRASSRITAFPFCELKQHNCFTHYFTLLPTDETIVKKVSFLKYKTCLR